MNTEHIILVAICIALCGIAYYFYRKLQTQEQTLQELHKKYETLQSFFTAPPSDLTQMYNNTEEDCVECDLTPATVKVSTAELDDVVTKELANIRSRNTPRRGSHEDKRTI